MSAIKLAFYIFIALILSTQLNTIHSWLYYTQVAFASLGLLSFFLKKPVILLGLAIPTIPFFQYGALSIFIVCYNLGLLFKTSIGKDKLKTSKSNLLLKFLILPFFLSLLVSLYFEFDFYLFKTQFLNYGLIDTYLYIKNNNSTWLRVLSNFCIWLNFLFLFYNTRKETFSDQSFVSALSIGVICSTSLGLFQVLDLHPYFSLNRDIFWLHVKRYEGAFTDPNALGVMSAILIPYFYYSKQKLSYLAGALLFVLAVFSESRTFWLGMISWFFIVNIKKPKYYFAFILPSFLFIPSINDFFQSLSFLSRFKRILETLNVSTLYDSLYSRLLMGEVALGMFKQNLLLGVGLDRFFVKQNEVANSVGLELGDWRDNANNFYLQIASEQGILGLFFLLILITFLFFNRSKEYKLSNLLLGILGIIFITGPHVYFEEVRYFFAIVLAANITKDINATYTYPILLASLLSLCFLPHKNISGFWQEEGARDDKFLWTSSKANVRICKANRPLFLRTFNIPMSVDIFINKKVKKINFTDTNWKSVELPHDNSVDSQTEVIIIPSKVWSPEGDKRWLGVMLKSNFQTCES